ncbi:hypothetical protein XENOCAPTIV_016027 [Xenoophorus captivus]|uniref:Uncharacterized protein n=1 Tax=Xenoophorus captivus TaxID=1517983 RepID=A0ABV0QVM7_9TELE
MDGGMLEAAEVQTLAWDFESLHHRKRLVCLAGCDFEWQEECSMLMENGPIPDVNEEMHISVNPLLCSHSHTQSLSNFLHTPFCSQKCIDRQ